MGYNVGSDVLQTIYEAEFEALGRVWGKCDTTNPKESFIEFNVAQTFV